MNVVISYDIPEDNRRNKIHKILKSYGQWTQYSLFECELTATQYAKLRSRLSKLSNQIKIVSAFTSSVLAVKIK
jgi:CRISPR-associated protein Cas2